jgi:hypothetical protein
MSDTSDMLISPSATPAVVVRQTAPPRALRAYSRSMSFSPENSSTSRQPNARPLVGSDGAAVCPPVIVEVHCECGRRQRVHAHDTMAYAQACMDCVAAPTGRRGCPSVCFSLN